MLFDGIEYYSLLMTTILLFHHFVYLPMHAYVNLSCMMRDETVDTIYGLNLSSLVLHTMSVKIWAADFE